MIANDPLYAFFQLPQEIQDWHEADICREQMRLGKAPNWSEFWLSLETADQWRLVASLLDEALPRSLPCPKVNLRKRAAPLKTPTLRNAECIPVLVENENQFNLLDLISEDKRSLYPHAAFFCPSGWGKDYNSSKLIAQASGETIACLIKEPEIWRSHCPNARIVCNGYNVTEIEKVLVEVCDRNQMRTMDLEPKTPINVIFSDYPSIVQGIKGITEKYVAKIIRDGRSNLIRFWFLLQESNVTALDMEGRSDLLSSITMVRGGKFALDYSMSLLKNGFIDKSTINSMHLSDRPCIVGNKPAKI